MDKTEKWKEIPDFNMYEISDKGRVRSKDRIQKNGHGEFLRKGKILKPQDNGKGYLKIYLKQDGKCKHEYVHRLVAFAFIENEYNKPFVNHIDCNPNNNKASNLEWCTHQENMDWMHKQGRAIRTKDWIENLHKSQIPTYKAVIGVNIETGEIIRFKKLNDVSLMGFNPSSVCYCCRGERGIKQHKGYRWRYE